MGNSEKAEEQCKHGENFSKFKVETNLPENKDLKKLKTRK